MDERDRVPTLATPDYEAAIDWLKQREKIDGRRRYSIESVRLMDSVPPAERPQRSQSSS
jgi:hypothetical protein